MEVFLPRGFAFRFALACAIAAAIVIPFAAADAPFSLVVLNARALRIGHLPEGWRVKVNRGTPDISIEDGPAGPAIRLKSRRASFALEREVDIDLTRFPVLAWSWKVTELPPGADFRSSRTDDQAAQVLVAFSDRRILTYIWDSTAPKDSIENASMIPFLRIYAVVCRSGPAEMNQWLNETRNVAQDYAAAYGGRPVRVKGIRLQINSQHTGTSAESYFGEVAFQSAAR